MYLKQLSLINFKNIKSADFAFSSKINCFIGKNGQGKTNILDSIYYLSFCKSNFNPIDNENIHFKEKFFVAKGIYDMEGGDNAVFCGVKRGAKKQFKYNEKDYSRLADHIGKIPLVIVSPYDTDLIISGSEIRRNFVNSIISQYDKQYLDKLIDYNRLLKQRNALLKQFAKNNSADREMLSVWDEQMSLLASDIYEKRSHFLEVFNPIFEEIYRFLSQGNEQVNLLYKSQLKEKPLLELLQDSFEKDCILQYTTKGIHKDDLEFTIFDHSMKRYGSQGQHKSYVLALKLAQFEFLKKIKHFKPIALFDDVFDKLDQARVKQLLKLVSDNNFGQVFVTDTGYERLDHILEDIQISHKIFMVEDGEVTERKFKEF